MKKLIILLLGLIPYLVSAQTITTTQKQEALNAATQFCNLLTRYCNGERTLTTQINALCSGADCSAYDDIKTNKEVTLRNYLMAIQSKHPEKLDLQLTKPALNDCEIYYEYEYSSISTFDNNGTLLVKHDKDSLSNVIIIFSVKETIPSKKQSITRKMIYSTKSKKITAFIKSDSPIISYCKGIDAIAQSDFNSAINHFEDAIKNGGEKFSKKEDCYFGISYSYFFLRDDRNSLKYATFLNDPAWILSCKAVIALKEENYNEAFDCYKQMEAELSKGNSSRISIDAAYYGLGRMYALPLTHYDSKLSAYYLKECVTKDGILSEEAAYYIYSYWITNKETGEGGISENDMKYSEALSYLRLAAEKGYPLAFLPLAAEEYQDNKNLSEAVKWVEKAALCDNTKAMAFLGKILTSNSQFSSRKDEGIFWLKESLEENQLEKDIEAFDEVIPRKIWPSSRKEVEDWLYSISNTNSSHSNSNSTSNTNSANGYSKIDGSNHSSSYSHYRYRKFNEPKDEICAGWSFGYVQKQWVYDYGDGKEKYGVFDDKDFVPGIQVGIRLTPQFGHGFAMNTGLYYEYYFSKSDDYHDNYGSYHYTSEEHSLYLPIHFKYDLNFSKWFQLSFYGGVGLDYGLSGTLYLRDDGETYDSESLYNDDYDMKRFNASLEYGAAIRIKHVQLDFSTSRGLVNMSGDDDYKVKQNKMFNISLSYMF